MKITRKQLRQIIKEERAKLKEAFAVDQFNDFVDAIRAGIGYIADWDVARQWEGMFGIEPQGEELSLIVSKLKTMGMLRDEEEGMMEARADAVFDIIDQDEGLPGREVVARALRSKDFSGAQAKDVYATLDVLVDAGDAVLDDEEDAWYIANSREHMSMVQRRNR